MLLALFAEFARVVPEEISAAVLPPTVPTTVELCVPDISPLSVPVKLVALTALVAVFALVAFPETFPTKFAVIVPALKLPEESRDTIVPVALTFVAVVAEFATLPEAVIVFSFTFSIVLSVISLFIISEVNKFPDASLCTTPAPDAPREFMEISPELLIFIRCCPDVLTDKLLDCAENPVPVLPAKLIFGVPGVLEGTVNVDEPPTIKLASVFNVSATSLYKFVFVSVSGAQTSLAVYPVGLLDVGNSIFESKPFSCMRVFGPAIDLPVSLLFVNVNFKSAFVPVLLISHPLILL